jgi:hypothetical protein
MIQISKAQAEYLRTHSSYLESRGITNPVARTMKQKSKRHNYYACEDSAVLELLSKCDENANVVYTYGNV